MITKIETIEDIIRDMVIKTEDMIITEEMVKTEEMIKIEEIKVDIKRTTIIKEDMMTIMMKKMSTENIDTIRIIIIIEIEEITEVVTNTIIKIEIIEIIRKDITKNNDMIRKIDMTITRIKKIGNHKKKLKIKKIKNE